MGSRLGRRASKGACLVVPPLFRADSGANLVKQGENVKGRPCGSVAQLAGCSHGKREALGSSPGRATIFSSPVTWLRFQEKYLKSSNLMDTRITYPVLHCEDRIHSLPCRA